MDRMKEQFERVGGYPPRQRGNMSMSKMKSKKVTIPLFIFYFLVLSCIVLLKNQFAFTFLGLKFTFIDPNIKRSINLIPFGGMLVLNGRPDYNEIALNALVFVPFGIFLCMLRKKKSFVNLILPIFLTSLFFEIAQYIWVLGVSDITDIIANTFGGMVGVGIFYVFHRICKGKVYQVLNAIALAVAFGFVLLMSMVRPL